MTEDRKRPFRFEDLEGKPEPEHWGPKYSRPFKTKRAFNDETNIPTNCASGQKRDFDATKHRAKLRAEFHAAAAADRRSWAMSAKIVAAYKAAMAAKRARLAVIVAPKPRYTIRAGAIVLAEAA
jgi:hypothetical protein